MRLGCCGSLDDAAAMKAAGFDFIEVGVGPVLKGDVPSSEYDKAAPDPAKIALPVEAANGLVPPSRPIVGPQRDFAGLQDFLQRVAKRGQRLGIKRFVFGSGGARKRPEAFDPGLAHQQLVEFTRMAGDVCAHHGITLVIEHLNKGETNTLNSLDECRALCDEVNHPNVQMLVDSFHFGKEKERDEAILELGDTLRHVHVAEVSGRHQPGHPDDPAQAFDFDNFFCVLRKIGYDERISFEGSWVGSIAEAGPALVHLLRSKWKHAGECEGNP
jgi:sugar phosphate isomerase/epimerase